MGEYLAMTAFPMTVSMLVQTDFSSTGRVYFYLIVSQKVSSNFQIVVGTFITEWDDGKEIWGKLLADHALLNRVAKLLVDIADHYGFDGWLVNIENSIEVSRGNSS